MLEGHHFQNAYITRDIGKALQQFRDRCGRENVASFEVEVDVKTPGGEGKAKNKLAFIWVNNLQYELIEPVSGLVDVYGDELPADDQLKFHHVCMRVDDWEEFRSRVDELGYPVVLEGGSPELKYVYLDARDFLGHYLEYVWMTPQRWQQIGGQ
ncbi:VOC family protein [Halioxenophilus sp. WMMB6]|uniref:VOC family protein n=1 Tax=Halioxenophilus sp. WMMB6 TaxID=3073815 RepID=UPI00295EBDAD|nr:VOC family protein [Halioxenophilus sp. WMMB6]